MKPRNLARDSAAVSVVTLPAADTEPDALPWFGVRIVTQRGDVAYYDAQAATPGAALRDIADRFDREHAAGKGTP